MKPMITLGEMDVVRLHDQVYQIRMPTDEDPAPRLVPIGSKRPLERDLPEAKQLKKPDASFLMAGNGKAVHPESRRISEDRPSAVCQTPTARHSAKPVASDESDTAMILSVSGAKSSGRLNFYANMCRAIMASNGKEITINVFKVYPSDSSCCQSSSVDASEKKLPVSLDRSMREEKISPDPTLSP
ncbi:MAG: hypothetical protein JSS82_15810 [Bacteroidetes bacterium]|nr:hypothetical protein [Bacteroidota bacterium]